MRGIESKDVWVLRGDLESKYLGLESKIPHNPRIIKFIFDNQRLNSWIGRLQRKKLQIRAIKTQSRIVDYKSIRKKKKKRNYKVNLTKNPNSTLKYSLKSQGEEVPKNPGKPRIKRLKIAKPPEQTPPTRHRPGTIVPGGTVVPPNTARPCQITGRPAAHRFRCTVVRLFALPCVRLFFACCPLFCFVCFP